MFGLPDGSDSKESAYKAGEPGSIPGLGRSSGRGHSNPLQYSCLGNPKDRGAWWATVQRVAKSPTRLSDQHFTSGQHNPGQMSASEKFLEEAALDRHMKYVHDFSGWTLEGKAHTGS